MDSVPVDLWRRDAQFGYQVPPVEQVGAFDSVFWDAGNLPKQRGKDSTLVEKQERLIKLGDLAMEGIGDDVF
mgnify:CR=1 FL=1